MIHVESPYWQLVMRPLYSVKCLNLNFFTIRDSLVLFTAGRVFFLSTRYNTSVLGIAISCITINKSKIELVYVSFHILPTKTCIKSYCHMMSLLQLKPPPDVPYRLLFLASAAVNLILCLFLEVSTIFSVGLSSEIALPVFLRNVFVPVFFALSNFCTFVSLLL